MDSCFSDLWNSLDNLLLSFSAYGLPFIGASPYFTQEIWWIWILHSSSRFPKSRKALWQKLALIVHHYISQAVRMMPATYEVPDKCWLIVLVWVLQRNSRDYGGWEVLLHLASWRPSKADNVNSSLSPSLKAWETRCPSSKKVRQREWILSYSTFLFSSGLWWIG